MNPLIDITGQRFGRLKVIRYFGKDIHGQGLWYCECDCGKSIVTRGSSLRFGRTKSCGCLHKEVVKKVNDKFDLLGQKFGKLTVVGRALNGKHRESRWECDCECGRHIIVGGHSLKAGTKSCGCLARSHGMSGSRTYILYHDMISRCHNKKINFISVMAVVGSKFASDGWSRLKTFLSIWENALLAIALKEKT